MNIPDKCFCLNNMTINPRTKVGSVTIVKAFEHGYWNANMEATQEEVDAMNLEIGVYPWESRAMETCSMFTWDYYANMMESIKEKMETKSS